MNKWDEYGVTATKTSMFWRLPSIWLQIDSESQLIHCYQLISPSGMFTPTIKLDQPLHMKICIALGVWYEAFSLAINKQLNGPEQHGMRVMEWGSRKTITGPWPKLIYYFYQNMRFQLKFAPKCKFIKNKNSQKMRF